MADDLIQETLVRLLSAVSRVEPGLLEPYAIVTARNVLATNWKSQARHHRNQHRVVDLRPPEEPDEELLAHEERTAVMQALARLSERERKTLLAHEVSGEDTDSLARAMGSSAGAIAAQLNRTRARLRVEYLLALERGDRLPTDVDRCCLRSRAVTDVVSERLTQLAICWNVNCADGSASHSWSAGRVARARSVSLFVATQTSSAHGKQLANSLRGWDSPRRS